MTKNSCQTVLILQRLLAVEGGKRRQNIQELNPFGDSSSEDELPTQKPRKDTNVSEDPCKIQALDALRLWLIVVILRWFYFLFLTMHKNMDKCQHNLAQAKNALGIKAQKGTKILQG